MKEVVYTAVFLALALILLVVFLIMFSGKKDSAKKPSVTTAASAENARYIPGIYTSTISLGDQTFDVQVNVEQDRITAISLNNLSETTAAMYPLMAAVVSLKLYYGAAGAALLSVLVVLLSGVYVEIYQVEDGVKRLTRQILTAYALVAPCKVLNMILGGGILRSGGRTAYVMAIDLVGTWGFGVPAGLVTAFVFALPVPYVYFALSLEEWLRFGISLAVFRRRRWMRRLSAHAD